MKRSYLLVITLICLLSSVGFAQKSKDKDKYKKKEFCSKQNNWSNRDKVSVSDLRESTISTRDVKVDSKNGRITVIGENRNDVLVKACVRAWARSEADARSVVNSIRVNTSGVITADVPKDSNASVSYEIRVPNSSDLDLASSNGRIGIQQVNGKVRFKTSNGRVTLDDVTGDVTGQTNNGRVTVKFSGSSFRGSGMNVETNNGRVSLYMPTNFAANVEAGTGNGRLSSDFSELSISGKKRKYGANRVSASLNGGGAKVRIVTGNGRVSIHRSSN
ncbi:MAG: hypothetical protein HKN25_11885 [Pyrinomonadaceae bacterium]|nr:hypothetical protein [Pyrinomonadaceae bacterium]